ncbi:family methyltransferase, partial [Brachionus plicatilis]
MVKKATGTSKISKNSKNFADMKNQLIQEPNRIILKYIKAPFDLSYGSNSIPLIVSCFFTSGNFLELGMGSFSTPILHNISREENRETISVDTDLGWVNNFLSYNTSRHHKIYYVGNYEDLDKKLGLNLTQLGVVLVDHIDAGRRAEHAKQFCNRSKIVIVHDAEKRNDGFYRYEQTSLRSHF